MDQKKNTDEHPAADQSAHQYGEARASQRTIGGEESFENGFVEPVRFCAVWVMHSIQVIWLLCRRPLWACVKLLIVLSIKKLL